MLNPALQEWRQAIAAMPCKTIGEQQLIYELNDELNDPRYMDLRHGARHTRNMGCTGPLCKKAMRDWQRERTAQWHARRGTTPRPYRRSIDLVHVDETLVPIKAAYDKLFDSRRPVVDEEQLTAPVLVA